MQNLFSSAIIFASTTSDRFVSQLFFSLLNCFSVKIIDYVVIFYQILFIELLPVKLTPSPFYYFNRFLNCSDATLNTSRAVGCNYFYTFNLS